MSIALGATFFGPQPPQQSPKQGFAPPDSSQLYSLFSAGVVAVSSISISTYKDAVTVQVAAIDKKIEVIEKANDKKIEVIEKANGERIDAIDKKIEVIEKATDERIDAIDKKIEVIEKATDERIDAIDKKTEAIDKKTEATLVLVVVAVVAGVWSSAKERKTDSESRRGNGKVRQFFFFGQLLLHSTIYPIISASPLNFSLLFFLPFHVQAVEKIVSKQWQNDKLNSWGRSGKNWFYSRFLVMKLF